MHRFMLVTVVAALAAAGVAVGARADSAPSAAAQMCLQGPQVDYYAIVGGTDAPAPLDFRGLAHGSDQIGPYVVAADHGECVSFVALNSKGKGSTKDDRPQESLSLTYTKVEWVTGTPK